MRTNDRRYVLLTVAEASVLKGAAQAWLASRKSGHTGKPGRPSAGETHELPALAAAIDEVRRQFRREQGANDGPDR